MAGIDWIATLPWLAAVALAAAAGAWLARWHALRRGLLDLPGERRSHAVPTPRGGGIGIVLAWSMACAVLGMRGVLPLPVAVAAAGGMLLVGGIGYIDDHRPLSPWFRLAVHVLAGACLGAGVLLAAGGPWLALLALASVAVLVNVWNFMDGIDGLATSQAALAALGLGLLSPGNAQVVLPALLLAAACLGFLPFNFPKARIFLGDVGSGALGFALAALVVLLLAGAETGEAPGLLLLAFLPLSAFLVDASLTLLGRMLRRERWWTAHVEHAYQRLVARGGSHAPVTIAYGAWTMGAVTMAVLLLDRGLKSQAGIVGGCAVAGLLVWRLARNAGPCRKRLENPSDDQFE